MITKTQAVLVAVSLAVAFVLGLSVNLNERPSKSVKVGECYLSDHSLWKILGVEANTVKMLSFNGMIRIESTSELLASSSKSGCWDFFGESK